MTKQASTPVELEKYCGRARKYYQQHPGYAGGHLTIDDLYETIRRLAKCVEHQRLEIEKLRVNA